MGQTSPNTLTVLLQTITVEGEHFSYVPDVMTELVQGWVKVSKANKLRGLTGGGTRHAVLLELSSLSSVIELENDVTGL